VDLPELPFRIDLQTSEPVMGPSESAPELTPPVPSEVLVVEDNFLIALDTQEMLMELGVARVRTADTVATALDLIAAQVPDFCLLDVNLGAEKGFEVAERLAALGVRFAFATGYGDKEAFPVHFADAAIVSKPYTLETLRQVLVGGE
jgi:CheY-like chemotaxis protein